MYELLMRGLVLIPSPLNMLLMPTSYPASTKRKRYSAPMPKPRYHWVERVAKLSVLSPVLVLRPISAVGPPMTAGEKDALRVAVQACWNVGSLSSEALAVTVTVAVNLGQDGVPDATSLKMTEYEGGSDGAARQAFEAARRAVIRCGANGFKLPPEKYEEWRSLELVFNPERMRIK